MGYAIALLPSNMIQGTSVITLAKASVLAMAFASTKALTKAIASILENA
jgi:hypothetical protein